MTCDPPPDDTDQDYLVLANEAQLCSVVPKLTLDGWVWEGSPEHYQFVDFMSWRKGHVNLIVTASKDFATRHQFATALCKKLNLKNKSDRVALFQAVLYELKL